ncbi:MAG: bacterial Ig-like domain-containing protein [Huintestinicola sp.]|uniref:bacterial Ig-like domain-containing protein n=1 Tax=Huintestinicola sp. TaxID=2981661 RepID=UPI003F1176D8
MDSPLKELKGWTAWYGAVTSGLDNGVLIEYLAPSKAKKYGTADFKVNDQLTIEYIKAAYEACAANFNSFNETAFVIQLNTEYKTFELPVYDGLGKDTEKTISVTNSSTGALDDFTGEYMLTYPGGCFGIKADGSYGNITTKEDLWKTIEYIANDKGEFDVTKAKLVRYVNYYISYDKTFTSINLLNNVTDNAGINYLNARKTDKSIWEIRSYDSAAGSYTYKMVSGGSFDTGLKEYLQTYDCNGTVYLNNEKYIYITSIDPTTWKINDSGDFKLDEKSDDGTYNFISFDSEDKYPVEVSDLAAALTSETNPTAGKKYDIENWEFWYSYVNSGSAKTKSKSTVAPKDEISFDYYDGLDNYNTGLVYFPEVDIEPAVTVTAPVIGDTPAATVTIPENDGYSVTAVSWSVDGIPLTSGEKFKGETQYTVEVTLKADEGLEFISTTPAEINGEAADTALNADGTLTVSYTFEKTAKAQVTAIEISALPTKTTYFIGDKLDVTGGKIKVYYEDEETETVDMTATMVSGFDNTKEGTQTLTVTYGGKTATFTVTIDKGEVTIIPSDDNVGGAIIDMPIEELMAAILDEEDLELIAQGVDIGVLMATVTIDPEYVDETDKTAIDNVLDDFNIGCYLDVKLFKTYSNGDPDKQVTDPNAPITISFEVPQYIIDQYPEDEYTYSVFCSHNGVGYPVQCLYDAATNTMTFTSDKFSTYALGVKPVQAEPAEPVEYTITADSHVTVQNTANAGDIVSVIVEDGYTAAVTDAYGNVIASITGTGSFTMPASDVTITCEKITDPEPTNPIVYYSIFTDSHVFVNGTKHKAGDTVYYRVDNFYDAVLYVNGKAFDKISGSGSFTMPAADVRIVSGMDGITYATLTASVEKVYVFSYDSDMNLIKTSGTIKKNNYIIIDLGEEYAGRTITIYKGRKSKKTVVAEGVLDENGKFKFENAGFGSNYTLIIGD